MHRVSEVPSEPDATASAVAPERPRDGSPCAFKGCSGFYHAADGPVGVVLCAPWGFEDLVMRTSWRLLAEAVAAAGYPCLRFDYPGTGNSLGASTSVRSVATWVDAIHDAAAMLRLRSGARRFVFVGQSLGATLALAAARTRSDVVALQLIAPVAKGRHYLRELAATGAMVAARIGIPLDPASDEGLSVVGFGLSPAFCEDLKSLDGMLVSDLRVDDVTIFDDAARKAGAEMAERMRAQGLPVRLEAVEPYHLMVSDATEVQALPVSADRVTAALRRAAPAASACCAVVPRFSAVLTAAAFREEPLRFGADDALFGILTEPLERRDGAPAIVLLDRGLNPHVGWRRSGVDGARALAAAGIASLRFDYAGLGESRAEPGRPADLIYSDLLLPDIRAAVDVIAGQGYGRIALAGVCSGAYMALTAADRDPRVTDVIAFNPQRFVWNPAENVADVIRFGLRTMHDYVGDVRSAGALRKLVRSRRRVVPALAFLLRRELRNTVTRIPLRLRSVLLHDAMATRVLHLFRGFAERGIRVSLVFTAGDPSLGELRSYFGKDGRDLRDPNVSIEIMPGLDHNITSSAGCALMIDRMIAAMGSTVREERRTSPRAVPDALRALAVKRA